MISRWLILALALAACHPAHAQYQTPEWKDYIAAGHLPYHRLSNADFPANDHEDSGDLFWINPWLHYQYDMEASKDEFGLVNLHITSWRVYSGIDKSSGHKSRFLHMKEMLPYLQSILDIHELYCRQLAAVPLQNLSVGRGVDQNAAKDNLDDQLHQLEQRTQAQIHEEVARLDLATDGGTDQKKMSLWRAELAARLKQAGISDRFQPPEKTRNGRLHRPTSSS